MQESKINKFAFVDPLTGDKFDMGEIGTLFQEADGWRIDLTTTTTKTQVVLFELARFIAMKKETQSGVSEARHILQTVYNKLEAFTITEREEGGIFDCSWRPKEGMRTAAIEEEMRAIIEMPIFKAVVKHVFGLVKKGGDIEVKKGGGGVRMASAWTRARHTAELKKTKQKVTAEEMRLEFVLLKLLRDYSTHRDKEHPLYLLGNGGEVWHEVMVSTDGTPQTEKMPGGVIEIAAAVLYKTYTGKNSSSISSLERRRIDGLLEALQKQIETIAIKQPQPGGRVKWYEITRPKITVDKVADLTEEEAAEREAGGELPESKTDLRISFNPAFTFDIGKKYALFPDDYLDRMEKAIGGGRSSGKYWLLNDYLNSIRGMGKQTGYETPADFNKLVDKLDLGKFKKKQGTPATVAEIEAAIQIAEEVGLVSSWTKTPGRRGQHQYQFKLNPEFGKD